MGPTGARFEAHDLRRWRASRYRDQPHPDAVRGCQHGACRSRANGPEPDAVSWADHHTIDRQERLEIDRQEIDRQEVDGSQVHEARGRREEGGSDEEAEDGARP
jgi:hypothetical protein